MSEAEDSPIAKVKEIAEKVAKPALELFVKVFPIVVRYFKRIYNFYIKLPATQLQLFLGTILCFFGGIYPTLFAAIEAAKRGGAGELKQALGDLVDEIIVIVEQSKKDDAVDEDNDGVADVDEIDDKEYIMRKTKLIMTKCNPQKVDKALNQMYVVWLSVISTLKVKFARTIALSLSISDRLKRPMNAYVAPVVNAAMPDEYEKWTPVVLGWMTKSIGMSIAWYIQTIISAVTSAIEGGLLMSRALLKICVEKGINPAGIIPDKHEETNIDETIAYAIAALGFYTQWTMGFDMPFPFNIFLMPFEFAEYYIRWTITSDD